MGDTIKELARLGCTGYIDTNGHLLHDGDTCPVYEAETIAALEEVRERSVVSMNATIHNIERQIIPDQDDLEPIDHEIRKAATPTLEGTS